MFYLVRVFLQPPHHVEEALGPFLFPFLEGFVTQVSYLIQVRRLCEALRFPRHPNFMNSGVTTLSFQVLNSPLKDGASTDQDGFIRFELKSVQQLEYSL